MQVGFSMVLALAMILFGAELFTNAVEWLGRKLGLGQGAVGSVLAALGTALPETAVPVTAILLGNGKHSAQEVGMGGILGAPFLLVTLGSLIMAISLLLTRRNTNAEKKLFIHRRAFERDMSFFLVAYALVIFVGCTQNALVHRLSPIVLVGLYGVFVMLTLRDKTTASSSEQIHPLYLQLKMTEPSLWAVLLQLFFALSAIVGGAQLLSAGVETLATWIQIPPFVLSALLIPLATELPETLNSVVWIRQGKDSLALGNITGAMVFQSTLVPALGIWLTSWNLNSQALLTGGLTLTAGALIFGLFRLVGGVVPSVLFAASLLYWVLPLHAISVRYSMYGLFWAGGLIISLGMLLTLRRGTRAQRA
jgi:cation:H+ antiporter